MAESRELLRRLSHGRSQIWYSGPTAEDRVGRNFDAAGPLAVARFDALKVTRAVDFYVWGPTAFTRALCTDLANRSVPEHANPYRNVRLGGTPHGGHRRVALSTGAFICRGLGQRNRSCRSRAAISRFAGIRSMKACWSLPKPATFSSDGRATIRSNRPADGSLLICCSRPRSDVIIDL